MHNKVLHELDINNDEVHILDTVLDKIIINNPFNGVIILNNALATIANLELLDSLKIENIFQKDTGTEILLYCKENKCLIHIPMMGFKHTIIPLPDALSNQILTSIYDWEHKTPILTTKDNFYEVDVLNQKVIPVATTNVKEDHIAFYKVWEKLRNSDVLFYDQDEKAVLVKEDASLIFEVYDLIRARRVIKKMTEEKYILNASYKAGKVITVHEHEIIITDINSDRHLLIKAPAPYAFTQARFLGDQNNKIAVLNKDIKKPNHSLLQVIDLS